MFKNILCSKYEKAEYVVKKRFIENRHETVPVGTGTLYTTAQTTKALSQKCFTRAHEAHFVSHSGRTLKIIKKILYANTYTGKPLANCAT